MDYELTGQQRALQESVRNFASAELAPGAGKRDETGEFPLDVVKKMAQMGLLGIIIPSDYGGRGVDFTSYTIAVEELARADASATITLLAHMLCASHILKFGSEEQKRHFLPPLAQGEVIGAWALTEPGGGSDAAGLRTEALADGDAWRLTGKKYFITNGGPMRQTEVMLSYSFRQAFDFLEFGYGAALAMITAFGLVIASYLQLRFLRNPQEEN